MYSGLASSSPRAQAHVGGGVDQCRGLRGDGGAAAAPVRQALEGAHEHVHELRVELRAAAAAQLLEALCGSEPRPVRAAARHGVVGVDDDMTRATSGMAGPASRSGYPSPSKRSW